MDNVKVKLVVGGAEYTLITDDDVKYVQELGKEVDNALEKIMKENKRISTTQAAILLALNYADLYKKASAGADNLRSQIKDYLDDAASAKGKADLARHETEKLKKELDDAMYEVKRLNVVVEKLEAKADRVAATQAAKKNEKK